MKKLFLVPIFTLLFLSTTGMAIDLETISGNSVSGVDFTAAVARFVDNGDGTVTDTSTNLIWLKNASCFGTKNWDTAATSAEELNSVACGSGECGLSDGSAEGDWRLPTKDELQGIGTDPPTTWPSLPGSTYPSVPWTMPSAPFIDVESVRYWSSTMYNDSTSIALFLNISTGGLYHRDLSTTYYVWPVR
jgi:hypothetical protein